MSDEKKIEPAIPASMRAGAVRPDRDTLYSALQPLFRAFEVEGLGLTTTERCAAAIGLLLGEMSDDDPRKLTWAMVDLIRDAARSLEDSRWEDEDRAALGAIANSLAAYLPPR